MSKRRSHKAVRLHQVSRQRVRQGVLPADALQPIPKEGAHVYFHGHMMTVSDVYEDRVALTGDPSDIYIGLLVRWLSWTWRVLHAGGGRVVLEAWGRTFMESPKLNFYQEVV